MMDAYNATRELMDELRVNYQPDDLNDTGIDSVSFSWTARGRTWCIESKVKNSHESRLFKINNAGASQDATGIPYECNCC